tara:strand:- start:2808 stop:6539 length:3732 start_codon:yes stop_codon:yes gene_type:complete
MAKFDKLKGFDKTDSPHLSDIHGTAPSVYHADNYQNFIYLFNDNQEIKVRASAGDQSEIISFEKGVAAQVGGYIFTEMFGGKDKIQSRLIGGDDFKDFPAAETATERIGEKFIGEASRGIKSGHDVNIPVATSDPGNDPRKFHVFDRFVSEGASQGSQVYKFETAEDQKSGPGHSKFYKFTYNPGKFETGLTTETDIRLREVKKSEYEENPNFNPNPKLKLIDPDKPFVFSQDVTYLANNGPLPDPEIIFKKNFNSFFKNYSSLITKQVKDNYYESFTTVDVATKIGVPYDFQSVLFDSIDTKQIGVATRQPNYDKIYNYYDSQYEPIAINIIETNVTEEKSLPSIYDFLYYPHQPNLRMFFKLSSLSMEDTNLAAINQYLDNFAKVYEDYIKKSVPKETAKHYMDAHGELNGKMWGPSNSAKPLSVQDLGWTNPNTTGDESAAFEQKFSLNDKKKMLISLGAISEDEAALDEDKKNKNPVWVNELKTGIYFSEKSLDIFEQAYDKDFVFPFLIKLNIPVETIGPIAKLLKQQGLLDSLNTYAASLTVPGEYNVSTYSNYYGGVLNGTDARNFNTLYDLKLPSFKILFKKPSLPPITLQDILNQGTDLLTGDTGQGTSSPGTSQPGGPAGVDLGTTGVPPEEKELTKDEVFYSWQRRNIDGFALKYNLAKEKEQKIIIKRNTTGLVTTESDVPFGTKLEIWTYCTETSQNCIDGLVGVTADGYPETYGWTWTAYIAETAKIKKANDNVYVLENTFLASIVDVTNTDIDPGSIYSERRYAADIYIDNLGAHASVPKQVLVYEDQKQTHLTSNSSIQALINKLKGISFKKKLQKLLLGDDLLRTPVDIHNGKLAHQETLMYEIAKYKVDNLGNESYLQSIFLPITNRALLSYYDTQVIPYKNYFYKIFAHKAILGTEYGIRPLASTDSINFKIQKNNADALKTKYFFDMPYQVEPFIEMVRVPYYNSDAVNIKMDKLNYSRVEDSPPLAPQINFVPFRNVNDEILILMNNSIGELEQYPRIMFDEEKELFDDVAISQDRIPGKKLIFKSDDSQGTFELYKVSNFPSSYKSIGNDVSFESYELESIGKKKNDSFIDVIRPNKNYYYVARFKDIHGKISNPTDVFKIRMIHEEGIIPYLTVEVLDIKETQKKTHDEKFSSVRTMQKYLYIQPNTLQTVLSGPELELSDDGLAKGNYISLPLKLGDDSLTKVKSAFGKQFKLRVTSKQTGKKIDINLTVKQPENIINE